jgi:hypothetical protein
MTGEPCEDARCKRSVCFIERESELRRGEREAVENAKILKMAEKIAREVWKLKGVPHPTDEQIQKAMRIPKLIEQAKRRLAEEADLPTLPRDVQI